MALFELIPAWLCFLCLYNLLDEKHHEQILQELHYLKKHLLLIAQNQMTDPIIPENLVDWPYESSDR